MKRLRDWPSRFAALVESARLRPFEWGTHDCCIWAAAAVEACTGIDLAATWRGTYADEEGAAALLLELGGLPKVAALAGPPLRSIAFAVTGDIGIVEWPDGTISLGVHDGNGWLCAGDRGLVHLNLTAGQFAWGVGRE